MISLGKIHARNIVCEYNSWALVSEIDCGGMVVEGLGGWRVGDAGCERVE